MSDAPEPRDSRVSTIMISIVTAAMIALPGGIVSHLISQAVVQERLEQHTKDISQNRDRIDELEKLVKSVETTVASIDQKVKSADKAARSAADAARDNGTKMDRMSADLNRLIGAFDASERRKRR